MRAPRAFACSYSSSTTAPAPSAITKPSRSLSQGRLARSGSSLRVDSALRLAEAAEAERRGRHLGAARDHDVGVAVLDAARMPMPIECVEVVQAVTSARFGPRSP